jgi:hypothetical protein
MTNLTANFKEGDKPPGASFFNALVTELARAGNIGVTAPLEMVQSANGTQISLAATESELWVYKITGNCNAPGTYTADGYRDNLTGIECANSALDMLADLTDPTEILVVNAEENLLDPAHWLEEDGVGFGVRRGTDEDGWPIIVAMGGRYRTSGGATLGEAGMKQAFGEADTAFWQRDSSDAPYSTWKVTGFRDYPGSPGNCQGDPPKLYGYKRLETYDAGGRKISETTETEFTIATGCCPSSNSISSPTFASAEEGAIALALAGLP